MDSYKFGIKNLADFDFPGVQCRDTVRNVDSRNANIQAANIQPRVFQILEERMATISCDHRLRTSEREEAGIVRQGGLQNAAGCRRHNLEIEVLVEAVASASIDAQNSRHYKVGSKKQIPVG